MPSARFQLKTFIIKTVLCFSLVLLTGLVYWQIGHHGTINADDFYLTTNKYFFPEDGEIETYSYQGLLEGMTTIIAGIWMPLMYMSVGAEMEFFGTDFGPYHLVTAGIHAGVAIVLFLLLFKMTQALWPSALTAALFAVHPVNVEAVSWLVCVRVVQSGLFCLLSVYFYALYAARRSSLLYTLSLFWFAASLFSVPMFPAVPFLLLLLDFWPLKRLGNKEDNTSLGNLSLPKIKRAVWEKFPFFGIMVVVLAIVMLSHDLSFSPGIEPYPLHERILNVFLSYLAYFKQILLPTDLAVYYPFPESFPWWQIGGAVLILAMITVVSLARTARYPFLIVGWFWFTGMLFPLSGIAQIGTQSRADHYAYIPLIGLLIFFCWGAAAIFQRWRIPRTIVALAAVTVVALFAFQSWRQAGYWKDSVTLMTHALRVTRNNFEAHNYLAQALSERGDIEGAIVHFQKALSIRPDHYKSHINLANTYIKTDRIDKAIAHFTRALKNAPFKERLHNNIAALYESSGNISLARSHYRRAIELNPNYAIAYDNLAVLEAKTGDIQNAITHFQQALRINPGSAGTHYRLAAVLHQVGRTAEALAHIRRAIEIAPRNQQYRQLFLLISRD